MTLQTSLLKSDELKIKEKVLKELYEYVKFKTQMKNVGINGQDIINEFIIPSLDNIGEELNKLSNKS